jgi:uncharacterized protein YrzB (UPF0473 family)
VLFFFGLRQKGKTAFILCIIPQDSNLSIRGKGGFSGNFTETFRLIGLAFFILTRYNTDRTAKETISMQEEYGGNFITVTDEDGNEFELEHLDTIEWNGQTYLAFFPAEQEGEETPEEELGLVILKAIQENGEEILSTLDSDEEMDAVYEEFMKELFAEEDEEDS